MLKRTKKLLKYLESPRIILSIITLLALVVIVFMARNELRDAWGLLGQANLTVLALLLPFQIMVYFAGGEMIFSYLRGRKLIKGISKLEQTRIALELNLVNHIFPSGGVSGISYGTWRLHKLGVGGAQATFAQVVRHAVGFFSFVVLLVISVFVLAVDGQINRYVVAASFMLVLIVFSLISLAIYIFSSHKRMDKMAISLSKTVNGLVRWISFGKFKQALSHERVRTFFNGMHRDFRELAKDKMLLIKPFIWGLVFVIFDVSMFIVSFWALGQSVNPAMLMVAYGLASMASLVALTPGGAGVYELIMIFFLTLAGVSADVAIAGTVLTRVILLLGTIIFGYIFYQHALIKYGKRADTAV